MRRPCWHAVQRWGRSLGGTSTQLLPSIMGRVLHKVPLRGRHE